MMETQREYYENGELKTGGKNEQNRMDWQNLECYHRLHTN